ncbi:hypothetical protein BH11BAC7_BH11BAC7_33000 [soil metagenome]
MSLQKGKQQGTASEIISLSLKNPTQVYRDDAGRHYWNGDMFKSKDELDMLLRNAHPTAKQQ